MAVTGLLLGAAGLILQHGHQAHAFGAARVEAQQGVRAALERMTVELREAGFGLDRGSFDPLAVAEATRVVIQHDLDGDGEVSSNGERITYALVQSTLRREAGGGAQPVLDGVTMLRFEYLDRDRRPTVAPAQVCSVVIVLAAGHSTALLRVPFPVRFQAMTEVSLRNCPSRHRRVILGPGAS